MVTSITIRTNMESWGADPTAEEVQRFEDAARAACESRWPEVDVSFEHLDTYGWFVPLEIETDNETDDQTNADYDTVYAAVFDAVDRAEFEHANRHATAA